MKKTLVLLLLAVILFSLTAACGQGSSLQLDPDTLAGDLAASDAFSDFLSPIDLKIAANLYGVDLASIASGSVYCSTGATAEEIAVFKCVDENAAKELKTAAQTRLDNQAAAYSTYAPQAVPAIENAILRQIGEYVICVVADNHSSAEAVVNTYLK